MSSSQADEQETQQSQVDSSAGEIPSETMEALAHISNNMDEL